MSRVLIADDDRFLTNLCSRAFEEAGYEVSIANDGNEAVKLLKEDEPDIVLLDLILPGIDGVNVMKFIRTRPELMMIPVLIVSNSEHFTGLVKDAVSAGATKFIHKGDLSPAGLVEEVRELVPPIGYIAPKPSDDLQIDYQPSASDELKGKDVGDVQGLPKTALIADDDRTIHGVLSFFLGQAGFNILSAFDGAQALEMAREEKPGILILDVTMPIKSGLETLIEWNQDPQLKRIPVIMLTASQNDEHKSKALGQGATRYLIKPFSPDALVDLAQEIIDSDNACEESA